MALRASAKAQPAEEETRGRGRPSKDIVWEAAERYLTLGATDEEVAAGIGVGIATLRRPPHAQIFDELKGRCAGAYKLSVRQSMLSMIRGHKAPLYDDKGHVVKDGKGNVVFHTVMPPWPTRLAASIFLAKNALGMTDKTDVTTKGDKLQPGTAPGVLTIVVDDDAAESGNGD